MARHRLLIPVILLLGLVILAGRWGLAAVHANEVRYLMRVQTEALTRDEAIWQRARRAAEAMRRLDPRNPAYLALHGQLLQRAAMDATSRSTRESRARQALRLHERAVARRPIWPHTWADRFELHALLGEYGEGFDRALRAAVTLGPWEPDVQRAVAGTGLMHWTPLGDEQQQIVLESVRRGLIQQPRTLLDVVRDTGRLSVVCRALADEPGVRDYCRDNL